MNRALPPRPDPFFVHPAEDAGIFDYALVANCVGFVLRSARRHRVIFWSCFVIVLGAAVALAAVVPSNYEVRTTVLTQRSAIIGAFSNPGMNREWDTPAQAARAMVMRRANLVGLCKQTNFVPRHLASRSPIGNAKDWLARKLTKRVADPSQVLERFVDAIEKKLWVEVGAEGTVTIAFTWSNPELAFDFVEAALQSFLEARHAVEISSVAETIAILESHDATVQKQAIELANALEEKARAVRARAPVALPRPRPMISATPGGAAAPDEELQRASAKLAVKQRALADVEEFRRRRLEEAQAKLAEQLTVYAPEHPLVKDTRRSIDSLSESSPLVEQLRGEVADLQVDVRRRSTSPLVSAAPAAVDPALRIQPEMPDLRLYDDPRLDYERGQLGTLMRQHASLVERIGAARMEIDTAEAAFKYRYSIISPAQMPLGPTKPLPVIVVVVGLLGGLVFAFFATTVLDIRSGRVVEAWQIERAGLTVLAQVKE